jgi:pimeloyl-ACP methyl ester carboxylesterase
MQKLWLTGLLSLLYLMGNAQNYSAGKTSFTFVDPSRNNRNIACEIYYPSQSPGQNSPFAEGNFGHVVLGHGFLMAVSAYESIANTLAENGFVVILPTTEGGFLPSHTNFARDLAFVGTDILDKSQIPSNFFYQKLKGKYAIGGHSMGGGCTYLSYQYAGAIPPSCLFTFAAAETNPTAIGQMPSIEIPNLLFAGEFDCVTPPANHQIPMYENKSEASCAYYVEILGAYHCQFNDSNFTCSLGEGGCPPNGISRQTQLDITLQTLTPWLKVWLDESCDAWQTFEQYLDGNTQVNVDFQCSFEVPEELEILFSGTLPACPGDILTLEASTQNGILQWNNGQTEPILMVEEEGLYYYTLYNGFCTAISESLEITFVEDPQVGIEINQDPILCPNQSILLNSNQSVGEILWSNGSSGYFLWVDQAGVYSYTLELNNCLFFSETIEITEAIPFFSLEIILDQDPILCGNEALNLSADPSLTQITWNNGSTENSLWATEEGMYFFYTDQDPNCVFFSDTLFLTKIEDPGLGIGFQGNTLLCPGETVLLFAENTAAEVVWNTGQLSEEILVDSAGLFFFSWATENCIFYSDTLEIVQVIFPQNEVQIDGNQPLCQGDTLFITTDLPNNSLVWNTGATTPRLAVTEAGKYWFASPSENCTFYSDTFEIEVLSRPNLSIETPQGFTLCPDSTLLLSVDSDMPLEGILWNTGDSLSTIHVLHPGLYFYTATINTCFFDSDSITIEEVFIPTTEFSFTGGYLRCPEDYFFIEVLGDIDQIPLWNDSIRADSFWVDQPLAVYYSLDFSGCPFFSDTLYFSYLDDWAIDSISGQKIVTPEAFYEYSVLEFPALSYVWTLEEPAQIIGGQNSHSITVYIPEFDKEELELQVQVTDFECKTIAINTWLSKANTNTQRPFYPSQNTIVLSGSDDWIVQDPALLVGTQASLYTLKGTPLHTYVLRKEAQLSISKSGLPKGIYFLTIGDKEGRIKTLKLGL